MDLIIRNAKLADYNNTVDIAIKEGKFSQITSSIEESAEQEIDAKGNLVSAPFVESHVHLDSALSVGKPRFNQSGTLLEAIEIWGEYKQTITKDIIKKNARNAVKWLLANGVQYIRTHTDSTEPTLMTMEAILEVKEEMQKYFDIQVVAFPQDGIFSFTEMHNLLEEWFKLRAEVDGGLQ